jgi:hypothetical protein
VTTRDLDSLVTVGGRRRGRGRTRRFVAVAAVPFAAALVLVVLPTVGLAGVTGAGGDSLRVDAPGQTERGSVVIHGSTFPGGEVQLRGGLLPVTAFAGADGAFTAEVVLHPGKRNELEVGAFAGTRKATRRVHVRQRSANPTGRLTGRVLDVVTRTPVPGATVRYDGKTAVTDAAGRYTLGGLPEGGVAVSARAAGRFAGIVGTQITGGTGDAGDLLLQSIAAPVRVGTDGGTFSGPGWRLRIPAGAVRTPTDVRLTTLEDTADTGGFGSPVVALGPKGVRFAKPVTVAIDPAVFGLDPAAARLVAVDPDNLAIRTFTAHTDGTQLVVSGDTLTGEQIRVQPVPGRQVLRRTAWQTVLSRIGADGTIDLRTAQQAFALAATPLPGVQVPAGPVGVIGSASGAIRWIISYLDQLTPAQRQVVTGWLADLRTRPGVPVPRKARATPLRAAAAAGDLESLAALVGEAADILAQPDHLGRDLGEQITVSIGELSSGSLGGSATFDADGKHVGPPVACLLVFTPRLLGLSASAQLETVVHETFHCFAAALFPNLLTYYGLRTGSAWVIEGAAEWAGDSIAGSDEGTPYHWTEYLVEPGRPLFSRSYDALGYYAHLAESGHDPWRVLDDMLLTAASGGNAAAFTASLSAGNPATALDTWASGYARARHAGRAWDTTGPGITGDEPDVQLTAVPNGGGATVTAPTVANDIQQLDLTADITTFTVSGEVHGRLGPSSGNDILAGQLSGDWCTKAGGCTCPDGSPAGGRDLPVLASGVAWLALTGALGSGAVAVTGRPLDDTCKKQPPDNPPPDPGPGGTYGDPHFVTFDHGDYDFQGAGDYVLAESTTDDFQLQGRYTRISTLNGPSDFTLNRGVAMRVGPSVLTFGDDATSHRGDPQVAALDGRPLALNPGTTNLPGGVTLTVSEAGHAIRWPDGTELDLGVHLGTNAFLTLAPSRWGHVRGLLGNADRDVTNDLTARGGTVVHDIYDHAQIYGVFGESWRVQGSASMFRSTIPDNEILPIEPPRTPSVSTLSDAARAAAEQICRAAGISPGHGLDQCILDVGLTGDNSFTADSAGAAARTGNGIDLGPLGAPVDHTVPLTLGRQVTGSLDTPFHSNVYLVDLQAGGTVKISAPAFCPGSGTFSITLVAPSGRPVARTHGPGCGALAATALTESGQYRVLVFDSGGFTGRYELELDGPPVVLTCQANEVAPNDDESGPRVTLPFTVNFGGRRFSSLWVNNNGNVTFDGPLSTFTPQPLATFGSPIVAAWFADVDTRGAGSQPVRFGSGTVAGRPALCVDYDRVGYFLEHTDKLNSFQLFIVDRGDVADGAFDIVFRYRQLQWETGDASGGAGGLGGTSAGVGYTNGTGQPGTFFEVSGSRQPGALLDTAPGGLSHTSTNSDQTGVHVFPIR